MAPYRHSTRRRVVALAGAALASATLALAIVGCRPSDELTQIVYTQDAPIVDEQAAGRNYAYSAGADSRRDLSQSSDDMSSAAFDRKEEQVPVFGVPATVTDEVDRVLYDENSGEQRTAPLFPDEPDELSDEQQDQQSDLSFGGFDWSPQTGENEEDAGEEESDTPVRGVSMHDDAPKVYNASGGLLAPLENVQCVATVGEYANLALMLGGPGTLIASDSAFLSDEGVQRVFSGSSDGKSWDLGAVSQVWSYDEAAGTYSVDFDALLAADPDMVLVPDGVDLLTEDQRQQLLDAGINVESAPRLDSVRDLKELVRWLGDTLAQHTVSGRDAGASATSYIDTYLGQDIESLIDENGGLTTYNDVDYSGEKHGSNGTSNWTVLVTDWDANATYDAGLWTDEGLAIATAGYGWSPANYYLSVGGVNNNAAQFPVPKMAGKKSGDYYVWQFNMSMLDPMLVDGYLATSDFGDTSYGWSQCLVGAPAIVNRESTFETTLGADDFRYVLCATQEQAEALREARDEGTQAQQGLYAAYDYSVGAALQESGVGPRNTDGVLIRSFIGQMGSPLEQGGTESIGQVRASQDEAPYEVATVGNGLYCDWVVGSVESFLLAFWTDDFYDAAASDEDGVVTVDEVDFTALDEEAARFYGEFYGYELSEDDLDQLHEGRVS